ncbi:MAG: restriction endonuclease subunit S, partial [Cyanobacteria bacterium MAG IRC1_bin_28]|nr:restriction endonuclease subunit S [Cyanobacteria bacterium MAG IRC1_bin_28]
SGRLTETPKRLRFGNTPSRARRIVAHGDTIVSTVRTYLKAVWYADNLQEPLIASTGFAVLTPDKNTLPKFVSYICESNPFIDLVTSESVGIAYPAIAETRLGTFSVCIPPLPEQAAIARFLDHTTQRVQHHIHAKQKLIKLLEEQKQVITHQAVTGQINVQTGQPYSTYKDSGVEWLRRVPEHWETGMVKRGYDIKLGKMLQIKPNNANDIEVSYLKAKDVQWFSVQLISGVKMWASPEDIEQLSVSSGDLLVCEGGEGGRCGILTSAVNGHIIQNSLHRVRSRDGNSNVFLQYTMRAIAETGWFVALNNKATIAHFTCEKFGALRIPFPGPLEQSAIADFLTHTNHRISRHRAAVKREIDLLHEYRTRLIADVVTGKLDMREVAAHLPKGDPLPPDSNCQDGTDLADPRRSPNP